MGRLGGVLAIATLVACKDEPKAPDPGPVTSPVRDTSTDVVRGSLTVDGSAANLTACRPGHAVHTYVEVVTSKGRLRFEDTKLYWSAAVDGVTRGDALDCDKLDRSWGGGVRTDGTAYWRGTLAFACKGAAAIAGDLTLDCGNITAEERAQLDGNRADMLDHQRAP